MIAMVLLPLADFKTITVGTSFAQGLSAFSTEMIVAGVLLALIMALFLLSRLWRSMSRLPEAQPEPWLLIDGSNVMHWQDNKPALEPVKQVVRRVRQLGYHPGIVFDANAGWKLAGRYLDDDDFAGLLGLYPKQVMVVPKGRQADPYLLETARGFGARIVTNDKFRDWVETHPEVSTPGFLIRGGLRGQEVWLAGLESAQKSAAQV